MTSELKRAPSQWALADLRQCRSLDEIRAFISKLTSEYGLAHAAYATAKIPSGHKSRIVLCTYNDAWCNRYLARGYAELDPVLALACNGHLPVDWADLISASSDTKSFFSDARSHGVGQQGVAFPIRGQAGERAVFTVSADVGLNRWYRMKSVLIHDFYSIANFIHDKMANIERWRHRPETTILNARERRCLELLARGEMPKTAASELELSESAIRLYTKTARQKLECSTTTQAVAKAVALELIVV